MGNGYTRQSSAEIVTGNTIEANPLNLEFNQLQSAFNGVSGHSHDGTTGEGPKISLANSVSGILKVENGGSGGINKVDATVAPTVNDDILDGYVVGSYWIDTVAKTVYTCVSNTAGAAEWKIFQPLDGTLTGLAAVVVNAADRLIYSTGTDLFATTALTPFARTLIDNTDAASMRTTLGLGSMSTQNSNSVSITGGSVSGASINTNSATITGGSISGITDLAIADGGTGASTITGAKTNLGLENVDNTSDLNKPISTLTQSALNLKQDISSRGILSGFRNKIINGCGEVAQRTAGVVSSGAFLCDHWQHLRDGVGGTISWQTVTFGAFSEQLPGNPRTYLSVTQSVVPGGTYNVLRLPMEGVNTLAGRKATVTLYARFPIGPGDTILKFELRQNFGTGGTPSAAVATFFGEAGIKPGTQFSKIQFVVDLPSITTKTIGSNNNDSLDLFIYLPTDKTFVFDITKVSVVEGDATAEDDPFSPRHPQQELALCQRYAFTLVNGDPICNLSLVTAGDVGHGVLKYPQEMRAAPQLAFLNGNAASLAAMGAGGGDILLSAFSLTRPSKKQTGVIATLSASLTQGWSTWLYVSTFPVVVLDAEL